MVVLESDDRVRGTARKPLLRIGDRDEHVALDRLGERPDGDPGGLLVLDTGGSVLWALGHRTDGVYFATPDEMTRRLQTAEFEQVHAWLQPGPTPLALGEPLESATGDPEIAGGNRPSGSGRPDR